MQVPEKYKKLMRRESHGASTVTVNSDHVEMILFSGCNKDSHVMADKTILRFGEYTSHVLCKHSNGEQANPAHLKSMMGS